MIQRPVYNMYNMYVFIYKKIRKAYSTARDITGTGI